MKFHHRKARSKTTLSMPSLLSKKSTSSLTWSSRLQNYKIRFGTWPLGSYSVFPSGVISSSPVAKKSEPPLSASNTDAPSTLNCPKTPNPRICPRGAYICSGSFSSTFCFILLKICLLCIFAKALYSLNLTEFSSEIFLFFISKMRKLF